MSEYIYSAFISYKHDPDAAFAAAIQEQIEHFYVPKSFRNAPLSEGKRLKRVFRDSTEFAGNFNLEESIKEALSKSAFLIVIISEETKHAAWVQQEIEFFLKDHDRDHILTVLSSGENPRECYPEVLTKLVQPDGTEEIIEPLSVDYRDYDPKRSVRNKENRRVYKREFPRIVAPILGVSYDDLVKRQERYRKQRAFIIANTALAIVSIALVYFVWSEIRVNRNYREAMKRQSEILVNNSLESLNENDRTAAILYALKALPTEEGGKDMPVTARAKYALSRATGAYVIPNDPSKETPVRRIEMNNGVRFFETDSTGRYILCVDNDQWLRMEDLEKEQLLFDGSIHEYGSFVDMYVCEDEFYIQTISGEGWNLYHVAKDGTFHKALNMNEVVTGSHSYSAVNVLAAGDRIFFIFQLDSKDEKAELMVLSYSPKDGVRSQFQTAVSGKMKPQLGHFKYDPENDAITFCYSETDEDSQVVRAGVGIVAPNRESPEMYDTEPLRINDYLIEGENIFYLAGLPEETFGDKGTCYSEYALKIGCIRMNKAEGWLTKDTRYGGSAEEPILKTAVIDGKNCLLVGTSDALSVHAVENGQILRRCELHSDIKDIWYKDTVGAVLKHGELARIDLSAPGYTVTETFNINIEKVKRIDRSFLDKTMTFILDDEQNLTVFTEGWGDESFVRIGQDAVLSIPGAATRGKLSAVILQDQKSNGYELSLIDTEHMTERWRKKLPEELFSGVYTDVSIDFTEDGSTIRLFTYGLPREEMIEFYYSVEDGTEDRIRISGTEGLLQESITCMTIRGYPAYLVYDPENPKSGYKILCIQEGELKEHKLMLPAEDTKVITAYASSDDGRYQLLAARQNGYQDVLLYDLSEDSCKVLEGISHRKEDDILDLSVYYSDGKVIIFETDRKICSVFDPSTGNAVIQIDFQESTVASVDIHDNRLLVFGSDGYLREYDLKKGNLKNTVRITKPFEAMGRGEWYYDEDSILLCFSDDSGRKVYVLDIKELEPTDEIESFVSYIPETHTFLVNDTEVSFGGFKKHTLDELIEMGHEQLGE